MYPKQVEDYSTLISDHFRPWAVEQGADPDKFVEFFKESLSKKTFPKWLNGGEIILTEQDVIECLNYSWAEYNLNSLKDKGLIDSIENENGEEIWFPTEEGRKYKQDENL
jgi:hypothetical protein